MQCSTCCRMCSGRGGVVACVALLAWFALPTATTLFAAGFGIARADVILVPIILAALGLIGLGLWLGVRTHGRAEPFMVGIVGSAATIFGLLVWPPIVVLGFVTVAGAIGMSQHYLRAGR